MALKPITRQEQIIVGKNLEPITRMERFLKEYGGGSGGTQSDWNQTDSSAADFIKNKPFMESYGDTLTIEAIDPDTFDPSTLVGEVFLKVCDTTVTIDDLSNGLTVCSNGETIEVSPEVVGEATMQLADGVLAITDTFVSVEEQGVGVELVELDGVVFPESGLYAVVYLVLEGGCSLTIPSFGKFMGIHKLDVKYVPNIPASKLPANTINVQPDWNQSDETAMDFIKNKPLLSKRLWWVTETVGDANAKILADPETNEKITDDELSEFIAAYGINNITIGDNPIIGYGSNGKYGVVTINQYSYGVGYVTMSQQHIFTTEFTAT